MAKLPTKMGATVLDRTMMYKVVVHTVLLYRSKSLAVIDAMFKVMEEFHHRVDQRIAEMSDRPVGE